MKRRYTYREITMILGVFVALIVAMTIWAAQKRSMVANQKLGTSTQVASPSIVEFVASTIRTVKL